MKEDVIAMYEGYREEKRLTSDNARRMEYLTTMRVFEEKLPKGGAVLDVGAGTGIYAFALAERGYRVTATDIAPRHVEVMREALRDKPYAVDVHLADACDLSQFVDGMFDIVLCIGPLYHLPEKADRDTCMSECRRVLNAGGTLVCAYIPRFFVFPYVATSMPEYIDSNLAQTLIETGTLRHGDRLNFWTDNHYATAEEMEQLFADFSFVVTDHFAQDGISPLLKETVNAWDDAQFQVWCEYCYRVCREKSILGASNHAAVIGRKLG